MAIPLIILGTGGNASDVLDVIDALNVHRPTWRVAGFLDDVRPRGSTYLGVRVLGSLVDGAQLVSSTELEGAMFINTIGSERSYRLRRALIERSGVPHERFATLVHPGAAVSRRALLGRGVCVNYGASIGGSVVVGDHAWLGPGCIVGHDSTLGAYCVLAPGCVASGLVWVGESCYVGTGAHIRQRVTLETGSLVGMGSVVLQDVPAGRVVVGSPAKPLDRRAPAPLEALGRRQ